MTGVAISSGEVGRRGGGSADVTGRGVRVHRQPCHMLLGGSVMRTDMHGSRTGHSRLAVWNGAGAGCEDCLVSSVGICSILVTVFG